METEHSQDAALTFGDCRVDSSDDDENEESSGDETLTDYQPSLQEANHDDNGGNRVHRTLKKNIENPVSGSKPFGSVSVESQREVDDADDNASTGWYIAMICSLTSVCYILLTHATRLKFCIRLDSRKV